MSCIAVTRVARIAANTSVCSHDSRKRYSQAFSLRPVAPQSTISMPSFLRDFRRRSKASFKTDKTGSDRNDGHSHSSSNDSHSQDGTTTEAPTEMPRNKSSSTLNSVFGRSPPLPSASPPLPSISASNSNLAAMNGSKTPPLGGRPAPMAQNSSRYSIAVSTLSTLCDKKKKKLILARDR